MSDPINPTAKDRAETRELCRHVIASVVEDTEMPLPIEHEGNGRYPVYLASDVEDLVMQLAQEVCALTAEPPIDSAGTWGGLNFAREVLTAELRDGRILPGYRSSCEHAIEVITRLIGAKP